MPMKMGIHPAPIGRGYFTFLDSRIRGNDGLCSFSENALFLGWLESKDFRFSANPPFPQIHQTHPNIFQFRQIFRIRQLRSPLLQLLQPQLHQQPRLRDPSRCLNKPSQIPTIHKPHPPQRTQPLHPTPQPLHPLPSTLCPLPSYPTFCSTPNPANATSVNGSPSVGRW